MAQPSELLSFSAPWRRWWLFLFPLLGYGAFIFYLSAQPDWLAHPPEFFSSDKVYHLLEYGVLGVLLSRVLEEYRLFSRTDKKIGWVLLLSLLYGFSDELHQWFVPGRFAAWADVLADGAGGWLGGMVYYKFRERRATLKK
jgi:VanZ family protein